MAFLFIYLAIARGGKTKEAKGSSKPTQTTNTGAGHASTGGGDFVKAESGGSFNGKPKQAPPAYGATQDSELGYQTVDETVNEADSEIVSTKEEAVRESESMLGKAVSSLGSGIKDGILGFFRSNSEELGTIDASEVQEIVTEVEKAVEEEVDEELEKEAESITDNALDAIEAEKDDAEEEGEGDPYNMATKQRIVDKENKQRVQVHEDIRETAVEIKSHLRKRAMDKEKAILEERLSNKLGKKVKIVVEDEEFVVEQIGSSHLSSGVAGTKSKTKSKKSGDSDTEGSGGSTPADDDEVKNKPPATKYTGYMSSPKVPQREGGTNNSGTKWRGYASDPVTPKTTKPKTTKSGGKKTTTTDEAGEESEAGDVDVERKETANGTGKKTASHGDDSYA
jgi:hypothetical protein